MKNHQLIKSATIVALCLACISASAETVYPLPKTKEAPTKKSIPPAKKPVEKKAEEKPKATPVESKTETSKEKTATTTPKTKMKEVVVSATKFEEEPWKSGSAISVVPEKTTKFRRPFQTAEVLRGEPGVDVGVEVNNATGAQGGVSQVSIRGMPNSRTLVEVDGLRFNRPIDGIANLSDLPPLLTGNIEVLRGAQSSLYGSEAQGGVVSLNAPRGQGDPSGGFSLEGGTFNTMRERVFSQGKQDQFDWNVEYSRTDTDQERPNNSFRQNASASRLGYDISETARLDFVTRWTDYVAGSPGGTTGFGANDPDNRLIRRTLLLSPTLTLSPFEQWESKLILGYIGVGQRFSSPPAEFVNHSESLQLNWQNVIETAEWNTVVAGVEARNEHTTTEASSGNNVFNRATEAAYVSDSIRVENDWGLTLSGRFDNNEGFRDAFTYRASQFFRLPIEKAPVVKDLADQLPEPDTRIHMSFGTAFRAPVISELVPLFGVFSGANAALVPETTEGFDIGITGSLFNGRLEGDITYFYNNIVNLIASDQNFVFQNFSEARTEGFEASGKWVVSKQLSFRQTLTLTSTTSKDRRFSGADLPRTPDYSASWTTIWTPMDRLDLSTIYNYVGPSFNNATNTAELSDYHRIDIYAEYRYNEWLKLFGRGENMLGYRYQQALGFPAMGRAFYAGVELEF
jgi:vitamin B12 transporter